MEESEVLETLVFLKNNQMALEHLAFKADRSRGRRDQFGDDDLWMNGLINPFVIDQQKIGSSKAWRRLENKTQVFSFQHNPHIRNRMSHTREVADNARKIALALGLNVDLCVAIADGHDVGHLPFGHMGESFIRKTTGRSFYHADYGAIVLQEIERKGKGGNLSYEVLDGIVWHSKESIPIGKPEEYRAAYWSDLFAWVAHDINDAERLGFIDADASETLSLGSNQRDRTKKCILALLVESIERGKVSFEFSSQALIFQRVKKWLFDNVYHRIDDGPGLDLMKAIYARLGEESGNGQSVLFGVDPVILFSLMTDWECMELYQSLISNSFYLIDRLGVAEIAPWIRGKKIDWGKPDFSWAEI